MAKRKRTKGQTTKHTHQTKDRVSAVNSGAHHVNLVTNLVISHE